MKKYHDISELKFEVGRAISCGFSWFSSKPVIGIEENPNRPSQKLYVLEIDNYAIIVPYVEKDNEIFLKTAFPSRKYTKRYGLKGEIWKN